MKIGSEHHGFVSPKDTAISKTDTPFASAQEFEQAIRPNVRICAVLSQLTLYPAYAVTGAGEGWQSLPFEPHRFTVTCP